MAASLPSCVAVLAALLASGSEVSAFPHRVRVGESSVSLAERYYGRVEFERVLVAANHLDEGLGSALVPGMRLEIPAVEHHLVRAGETWASIAEAALGAGSRAEVLARLNAANPWEQPAVGREVLVPFPLRYVASQGDTADSLAYRVLGRRDDAWMLLHYNGLQEPRFGQGQVLLVPLIGLALSAAGKVAAADAGAFTRTEGGGQVREQQDAAESELTTLANKSRHGDYVGAIVVGAGLLGRGNLTEPQFANVYAALTEAYVALGAKGLAVEACAGWRRADSKLDLDTDRYSPKIVNACLGHESSDPRLTEPR